MVLGHWLTFLKKIINSFNVKLYTKINSYCKSTKKYVILKLVWLKKSFLHKTQYLKVIKKK